MLVSTNLGVSVRLDGTDYWEGNVGTGLAPATPAPDGSSGTGSPLSRFSGLVEQTLGSRPGGVAMMAMASPTGFLDLAQTEVTGADQTGTETVDGTSLTEYQVSLDPTQLATSPGTTTEEATAIAAAVKVLQQQGLTGLDATIGVDASGFIHQATSVATFSGGGTVTLRTTLSDFGCAGTVLMPGQQGTATAPAGCVTPDTGLAPPSTTTTAPPSTTTTAPPSTTTAPTTLGSTFPSPTTTTTTGSPATG
jgi:hypothetical protein